MFDLRENFCIAMPIYTTPGYLLKESGSETCISMFTAAQFTVTESWNQSWYSATEDKEYVVCIHNGIF